MPTNYKTKDISKVLGIRPRRLTGFFERSLIPVSRPGTGAPRLFSRADVIRIAVLDRLVGLGVSPARASGLAVEYANAAGVLVLSHDGAEVQPRQGFDLPLAATILDLDSMRAEINERLAA